MRARAKRIVPQRSLNGGERWRIKALARRIKTYCQSVGATFISFDYLIVIPPSRTYSAVRFSLFVETARSGASNHDTVLSGKVILPLLIS
jgi:hypothetical protein